MSTKPSIYAQRIAALKLGRSTVVSGPQNRAVSLVATAKRSCGAPRDAVFKTEARDGGVVVTRVS